MTYGRLARQSAGFSSEKTCANEPDLAKRHEVPVVEDGDSADSWPRCWSASRAKCVRRATSRRGIDAKTPHIRCSPCSIIYPSSSPRQAVYRLVSSRIGAPSTVSLPTLPIRRSGTWDVEGEQLPAAGDDRLPPPSPKSESASGGRSSSAPMPAAIDIRQGRRRGRPRPRRGHKMQAVRPPSGSGSSRLRSEVGIGGRSAAPPRNRA